MIILNARMEDWGFFKKDIDDYEYLICLKDFENDP
jgi:hypothetical protein